MALLIRCGAQHEGAHSTPPSCAGVERFAFSIVWELTPDGHILDQWTGRSIIRTCAKLAYEHAQLMIDGQFRGEEGQEPPPVHLYDSQWPEVSAG